MRRQTTTATRESLARAIANGPFRPDATTQAGRAFLGAFEAEMVPARSAGSASADDGQDANTHDQTKDVTIAIIGGTGTDSDPAIITDPHTAKGGSVFGAKGHPGIGVFMFWNRDEDPRTALQAIADRRGISVDWR